MTWLVQNKCVEEFGEELPDFDEMNARLLGNIGVIKANIDVSERSAAFFKMKEAVEKYDKAVELSGEMR